MKLWWSGLKSGVLTLGILKIKRPKLNEKRTFALAHPGGQYAENVLCCRSPAALLREQRRTFKNGMFYAIQAKVSHVEFCYLVLRLSNRNMGETTRESSHCWKEFAFECL